MMSYSRTYSDRGGILYTMFHLQDSKLRIETYHEPCNLHHQDSQNMGQSLSWEASNSILRRPTALDGVVFDLQ
jgi:hypothetical protein